MSFYLQIHILADCAISSEGSQHTCLLLACLLDFKNQVLLARGFEVCSGSQYRCLLLTCLLDLIIMFSFVSGFDNSSKYCKMCTVVQRHVQCYLGFIIWIGHPQNYSFLATIGTELQWSGFLF